MASTNVIDAIIDEDSAQQHLPTTLLPEQHRRPSPKDLGGDLRMSRTSNSYDLDNKGYLNDTEAALRQMDSSNRGFLQNDKVYMIMQSLQEEQKKSATLIEQLTKEHKKSVSLKRGLVYLCGFSLMLALSNIGTSFAAARLAKDTEVTEGSTDLMTTSGRGRISTTAKIFEIPIHNAAVSFEEDPIRHRRALQETEEVELLACNETYTVPVNSTTTNSTSNSTTNSTTNVTGVSCGQVGQIDYNDAVVMYQAFCPNWPFADDAVDPSCQQVEISEATLNCQGRITRILGGEYFPSALPGPLADGRMVFPARTDPTIVDIYSYSAVQVIANPDLNLVSCVQNFQMKLYCNVTSGKNCLAIASMDEATRCPGARPQLCPSTQSLFSRRRALKDSSPVVKTHLRTSDLP